MEESGVQMTPADVGGKGSGTEIPTDVLVWPCIGSPEDDEDDDDDFGTRPGHFRSLLCLSSLESSDEESSKFIRPDN